jgi:5'-deoxynucleotidase YfbR-like HD superfamily hydrolase
MDRRNGVLAPAAHTEEGRRAATRMVPIDSTPAGRGSSDPQIFGDEFQEEQTLNLKALLLGDINRLRYTWRFNMSLITHRENVAEHSYYVAVYAWFLAEWVHHYGGDHGGSCPDVNVYRLMATALFHDAEESRTGDFSRLFKHSHPELKAVIEKYSKVEFERVVSEIFPNCPDPATKLLDYWEESKDDTPEGCIIALADFLSVFSHMWQEINNANATMLSHYDTMLAYATTFDAPRFEFLRPVVKDVQRLVRKVLGDQELRRRLGVH